MTASNRPLGSIGPATRSFPEVENVARIGLDATEAEQGKSEIAHFHEQPVEGGLIGNRADQDGRTVSGRHDSHPVKPVGPLVVELTANRYPVDVARFSPSQITGL